MGCVVSGLQIPDSAIEAGAAEVLRRVNPMCPSLDEIDGPERAAYANEAAATLRAAAPLIVAAELRRMAAAFDRGLCTAPGEYVRDCCLGRADAARALRDRAAALEGGQS